MKNHNRLVAGAFLAASVSAGVFGGNLIAKSLEEGHKSEHLTATLHAMPPHTGYDKTSYDIAEAAESANEHSTADGLVGILAIGVGAGALTGAGVELQKTRQ